MKFYVKIFQKGSKVDQYMVQNHKFSGVYLWCNFVKLYSSECTNIGDADSNQTWGIYWNRDYIISHSYISLEDTINHLNTIKINSYPWYNVSYFCDEIFVDFEHIVSSGAFKPEHLGYITQFWGYFWLNILTLNH